MNRRIRNRTYGGVGGRRTQVRLLPDAEPNVDRHRVRIYLSLGSSPENFQDSVVNLLSSFGLSMPSEQFSVPRHRHWSDKGVSFQPYMAETTSAPEPVKRKD